MRNYNKTFNLYSLVCLIILLFSSCEKEEIEKFIEFRDFESVNVIKNGFPINNQEQAELVSFNESIWDIDKNIFIKSQEELHQQLTQFNFDINKEVNFENYFLLGVISRIGLVQQNIEYHSKLFINQESNKVKIQICNIQYGESIKHQDSFIPELHWFVIPKYLNDSEFIKEYKTERSKELMNLSIIEGVYKGTVNVQGNNNYAVKDVELTAQRVSKESSDMKYTMVIEAQNIELYGEFSIKFEDKFFAEGRGGWPTQKYFSNHWLNLSNYDKESNMIRASFQDLENSNHIYFVGTKNE
ncbi:hypothetical protein [Carboxylicivirga marina]|uniref:Lipoprotein n=1 Tax=Carboxylicivirga marina TaxID=2800988 RepID=A0ABS1HQA0_9BACT|nr:hypothetical protein [Carboxylicivirga marina]MBK3519800.1 hypothetical protein [Carboxylicivirga marina]